MSKCKLRKRLHGDRQNDAWGVNYGDDGNDGTLELNGANIPVSAGTYNIIFNHASNPPTIEMYQW